MDPAIALGAVVVLQVLQTIQTVVVGRAVRNSLRPPPPPPIVVDPSGLWAGLWTCTVCGHQYTERPEEGCPFCVAATRKRR